MELQTKAPVETQMMIKEIYSFEEYESFIAELAKDPLYSDPHFTHSKDILYNSDNSEDERPFAVFINDSLEGIFVWLILPKARLIEMIIGFTREERAFLAMLSYLEKEYPCFNLDFVFNPKNTAISKPLKEKGAAFDPPQQKMLHMESMPYVPSQHIEQYSEKWKEQYRALHRTEMYWTAERVISAPERFATLLAIKDGQLQGYLDVTKCFEENEIYDLFVKPGPEKEEYESALLSKAIELNQPHRLMVLVDVDNNEEIELYNAAGFRRIEGFDSVLAQIKR